MKSLACICACVLLSATVVHAQGVGSSGEVSGTVYDQFGAVLAKVTVSLVDTQTGLTRKAVTDGAGQYRVVGLPPSTYDVRAEVSGFATEVRKGVSVAIGQTLVSDFRMKPAQVATVIEVMSEPPTVETERGSQADRITQQYIADLPIDRKFAREAEEGFTAYLYFSGTTFFTLGYGDMVPTSSWGRALSVAEAGIGFGFLAVVISYLPVLYQAFSRREITISLLDARAGSPPTAGELLRRLAEARNLDHARQLLIEWERWAAEMLESHLSFPVLRFFRSQHDNQSWIGALTTILDTSALLITAVKGSDGHQARLTFAMARHAAVDLGLVSQTSPLLPEAERLTPAGFARLQESLRTAGLQWHDGPGVQQALTELRALYEPIVNALAVYFHFQMPPFQPDKPPVDNWQTSPWMPRSPGLGGLPSADAVDEH